MSMPSITSLSRFFFLLLSFPRERLVASPYWMWQGVVLNFRTFFRASINANFAPIELDVPVKFYLPFGLVPCCFLSLLADLVV